MARVKRGNVARNKRKKILDSNKGYRGAPNRLACSAGEKAYIRAGVAAYRDRRVRRRNFRRLWILRINAASRNNGLRYSELMKLLKDMNLDINRKQLAELANHEVAFAQLVEKAKAFVNK